MAQELYVHYEMGRMKYDSVYADRVGTPQPTLTQIQDMAKRLDFKNPEILKLCRFGKLFQALEAKYPTSYSKEKKERFGQRIVQHILGEPVDPFILNQLEHEITTGWQAIQTQKAPVQPPLAPASKFLKLAESSRKKHKQLTKQMRNMVWNQYIGEDIAKHKCFCCKKATITQQNYECGHVVARANEGEDSVENMRPICGSCNRSMGSENMVDYIVRYRLFIG